MKDNDVPSTVVLSAAKVIKTAILQSQERAVRQLIRSSWHYITALAVLFRLIPAVKTGERGLLKASAGRCSVNCRGLEDLVPLISRI